MMPDNMKEKVVQCVTNMIVAEGVWPVLVFVRRIDESAEMADRISYALGRAGAPSEPVSLTGRMSDKYKDNVVSRLIARDMACKFVVCTDVWGHGIDVPPVKGVVLCDGVSTQRSIIQKFGRGLREDGGRDFKFVCITREKNKKKVLDVLSVGGYSTTYSATGGGSTPKKFNTNVNNTSRGRESQPPTQVNVQQDIWGSKASDWIGESYLLMGGIRATIIILFLFWRFGSL